MDWNCFSGHRFALLHHRKISRSAIYKGNKNTKGLKTLGISISDRPSLMEKAFFESCCNFSLMSIVLSKIAAFHFSYVIDGNEGIFVNIINNFL